MGTKIDNKGFTLVELIAVMAILVSIALVAVGGITSSLEKREIKECKEQQELAISAAKIYFSLNDATSVSIDVLNSSDGGVDYFKNDNKIDRLSQNDKISFSNGEYIYIPSLGSCVTIVNNVTNGNNYVITYNYNIDEFFDTAEYLDTGYIVDWDKDFSIETDIKVTTSGKRYLIIGNYNASDLKEINIEINASNQLRLYLAEKAVDKTFGAVSIGENIKIKFDWDSLSDTYTISAKGTNTDISSSGTYSMSGKSANSLRIGTVDYRSKDSPFNPINVSSLKISTNEAKDTTITLPTVIHAGMEFLGWSTSTQSYDAGESYLVNENKTLYANRSVVKPVLDDGMIPIIIKDDGTVLTVSFNDWYDYDKKKWANAVLVKESGTNTRSYYKSNIGVVIPESDILAYYVWIPRYKYKIWTLSKNSEGNEKRIEIEFEKASASITTGSAIGDYITHPAFVWDGSPVAGIWVGKFETGHTKTFSLSKNNTVSCANINCELADNIYIKPNTTSIKAGAVGRYFYLSRSMTRDGNPFGLSSITSDSHIAKNTEWGAVAYLADSEYGINDKIRKNNTVTITGCGALTDNASNITNCEDDGIAYGKASSYPQSTTGNISGIFDMAGGRKEYVMTNYGSVLDASGLGSFPASKYYSLIPSDPDNCTLDTCGGMGVWETHGWYGDSYEQLVSSAYPWQNRGSSSIYSYGYSNGGPDGTITYRSVLIVQ